MTFASEISGLARPELDAAIEAAGVGLWRWHLAEQRLALSPQAVALLGAAEREVSQAQFLALVHPGDRPTMEQALQECLYARRLLDLDFRILADGKWRRMRGQAPANSAAADGILLDIGIRRSAQLANNRLAAIVSSSDDAIIGKTLDGIVTDWNRSAEVIFGYRAEEMIDEAARTSGMTCFGRHAGLDPASSDFQRRWIPDLCSRRERPE